MRLTMNSEPEDKYVFCLGFMVVCSKAVHIIA